MEIEQRERLANVVTAWMEANNLSQRQAAKLLDVSQSAIASWAKGQNAINWGDFEKLATVLGKTPEALLAEVRGVAFQQLPAAITFQDVEKLAMTLPWQDRARLSDSILQSFVSFIGSLPNGGIEGTMG